jgi:hypothetical protein
LIPDIVKFLPIAIFKMVATTPNKFNISGSSWDLLWTSSWSAERKEKEKNNNNNNKIWL